MFLRLESLLCGGWGDVLRVQQRILLDNITVVYANLETGSMVGTPDSFGIGRDGLILAPGAHGVCLAPNTFSFSSFIISTV